MFLILAALVSSRYLGFFSTTKLSPWHIIQADDILSTSKSLLFTHGTAALERTDSYADGREEEEKREKYEGLDDGKRGRGWLDVNTDAPKLGSEAPHPDNDFSSVYSLRDDRSNVHQNEATLERSIDSPSKSSSTSMDDNLTQVIGDNESSEEGWHSQNDNQDTRKDHVQESRRRSSSVYEEDTSMPNSDRQESPAKAMEATDTKTTLQESEQTKSLEQVLHFTPKTAINFMHFHKTGGVTFKTSLHVFYNSKFKSDGSQVVARDSCYKRESTLRGGEQSFAVWRCDWDPIRQLNNQERNGHDFVFGHQFGLHGVDELLNLRDLRTFTVMRHPFDRKVSFYYHFFVRELGRKESGVSFEEVREFLLFDKLRTDAELGRDLGPNYMAGRLLSDGTEGFVGSKYHSYYGVEGRQVEEVVEKAVKIIRKYVFVGLQEESAASRCMLRKTMEVYNKVNGVSNVGLEAIDGQNGRLNTGSYSMSAKEIWGRFSMEDRIVFDLKEKVDLAIYREGSKLFRKHVQVFGCADRVKSGR